MSCQCVIGGRGLGLCKHGMGAGRLRRRGIRHQWQVGWFSLGFQGHVGRIGPRKCAGERILRTQRMFMRVLGRFQLESIEKRSQYTHTHSLRPYMPFPSTTYGD